MATGPTEDLEVKTTRSGSNSGAPISLRQSTFTYETHGLLDSERVEGMTGTFPNSLVVDSTAKGVSTYYGYDTAGNRTSVRTCSTSISASTCKSATAATSQFHAPIGSTTGIRYSKTAYDSLQRFPVSTAEVFSSGGDNAQEIQISTVTQRNEGGDPLEMSTANGVATKIRYGALAASAIRGIRPGRRHARIGPSAIRPTARLGWVVAYVPAPPPPGAPNSKVFYD